MTKTFIVIFVIIILFTALGSAVVCLCRSQASKDTLVNASGSIYNAGHFSLLVAEKLCDRITEGSHQKLNEMVDWLKQNSKIMGSLKGHTGFGGNTDVDPGLSEVRVIDPKRYPTKKVTETNNLLTKAFWGTLLIIRKEMSEPRALDRRERLGSFGFNLSFI